jgi:hypothetical protein
VGEQQKGAVKCSECGAEFETREQLEGHMQRAHQSEGMGSGSDEGMPSDVEGMQSGGQMTPEP